MPEAIGNGRLKSHKSILSKLQYKLVQCLLTCLHLTPLMFEALTKITSEITYPFFIDSVRIFSSSGLFDIWPKLFQRCFMT
ncbi:unnamed protein product [Rhizophagus irregularis]|nr:unnamed protein product [Rhizophagus irregularis]